MNKLNKYMGALLLIAGAAACQTDDTAPGFRNDPDAVRISASVGQTIIMRSNPLDEEKQTQFNAGDVVSVNAANKTVQYTFDSTTWNPAAGDYLRWTKETMTFRAYYPTSSAAFTLPVIQSTPAQIVSADYMTATQTLTRNGHDAIDLELQRRTARIQITIGSFGDQFGPDGKAFQTVSIYSGAAGYSDDAVTGDPVAVSPLTQGDGNFKTYIALVIPTEAKPDQAFVTLEDSQNNRFTVKGIRTIEAGKSYAYTLHVGKDTVSPTSVKVTDWATGEVIDEDTELIPTAGNAKAGAISAF